MWCEEERWRQEGRNERTKGDNGLTYRAVIATASLGPDRRPQDSADLPSYTYLRLRSMSSFLRRTYHRTELNEATISPNEKYERFHKAPRRPQALRYDARRCYNHRSVSKPR